MQDNSSRTRNSFINIIVSLSANGIAIIIGIIARAIFISILGIEYLGLNGLFTNIITMLSIVELGFGSAIVYNLYKPIANNDSEKIKSLMAFYKKSYRVIGILVAVIGLAIIPILPSIIGEVTIDINIIIVFSLFLADTVLSYFLSYKRSMLYANQKNYIINLIHIVYLIILNTLQLLFLYFTKNFYLYLIIKVIMRVAENACITIIVNRMYPFLKGKDSNELDKETKKDIFKKVKGLFYHQIGSFIINGTDNIIISKFLGIATVGLYANYFLIINAVQSITKQIIDAVTPSIGNLLVTEDKTKQFDIFKKIRFANFWISTFCAICLYVIMEPFINVWIGNEYMLPNIVLLVLVINFYQRTTRNTYASFKTAAGIFHEDRFVPIIESVLNIIASVILVQVIGLAGVFVGTFISSLILWCFSYPKFVYKKLFNRSYKDYIKETVSYLALFLILLFITSLFSNLIVIENNIIHVIVNIVICLLIPNFLMILAFKNTDNFKYYIGLFNKIRLKIIERSK